MELTRAFRKGHGAWPSRNVNVTRSQETSIGEETEKGKYTTKPKRFFNRPEDLDSSAHSRMFFGPKRKKKDSPFKLVHASPYHISIVPLTDISLRKSLFPRGILRTRALHFNVINFVINQIHSAKLPQRKPCYYCFLLRLQIDFRIELPLFCR